MNDPPIILTQDVFVYDNVDPTTWSYQLDYYDEVFIIVFYYS